VNPPAKGTRQAGVQTAKGKGSLKDETGPSCERGVKKTNRRIEEKMGLKKTNKTRRSPRLGRGTTLGTGGEKRDLTRGNKKKNLMENRAGCGKKKTKKRAAKTGGARAQSYLSKAVKILAFGKE